MSNRSWPLSQNQLMEARKEIAPSVSFSKYAVKHSKMVEEIGSGTYTHRCICPHKDHKGGNEKTPSFYFSEETKRFQCFGCGINGDVFDFIALMKGMTWWDVLRKFIDKNNVDVKKLSLDGYVDGEYFEEYLFKSALKLSQALKTYLDSFKNSKDYLREQEWVDRTFKKIDQHLSKVTFGDKEKVKGLESQIMLEIERRKFLRS